MIGLLCKHKMHIDLLHSSICKHFDRIIALIFRMFVSRKCNGPTIPSKLISCVFVNPSSCDVRDNAFFSSILHHLPKIRVSCKICICSKGNLRKCLWEYIKDMLKCSEGHILTFSSVRLVTEFATTLTDCGYFYIQDCRSWKARRFSILCLTPSNHCTCFLVENIVSER